jgi:hypothetical protein
MEIYLDFDGTVVEHQYPKIGRSNFGCLEIIKKLQDAGHEIILNTYRADCEDGTLEQAINVLNENHWKLEKDRIQPITKFCKSKIYPNSLNWEEIKQTNILFIDDSAANTPLKKAVMSEGMMVDWNELDKQFEVNEMYNKITVN